MPIGVKRLLSCIKNLWITRKHLDYALRQRQKRMSDELEKTMQQHQKHMDAVLKQYQNQAETLFEQQQKLMDNLQQMQQQTMISNAALLAYASGRPTESASSWDLFLERLEGEIQPLEFLKVLYDLHDALTETNAMEMVRQGYVNAAMDACLRQLHSEKDPDSRQLIYDALKNEVFDELELVGYGVSFYTNETSYLEMQKIVNRAYDYNYFSVLSKPFYEQALIKWYHEKTGWKLNLTNPVTYNDKINWIKLNEHDLRKTRYTDKYAVRKYVEDTIGNQYLIPLFNVWDNPDEIDFDLLPEQFVLKATHGSGWNLIVPNKSALNIPDAVKRMKWWLGRKLSFCNGLELHYDGIKPRIIAEKYIENSGGELNDYKVWCFDGKAHFIQYISERKHGLKMAFFDREWTLLPFITSHEKITEVIEKPDNLEELITISEKLAADFNHVRVDFYRMNNGEWKFGEMTFTPSGGRHIWMPPEYDRIVGDLLNLDCCKETGKK